MATKQNRGMAQWKLRRTAQRALGVLERHQEAHAALRALARTFVPTAAEFMTVYDAVQAHGPQRKLSTKQQAARVAKLNKRTRMWLALLRRDVPELVTGSINWHAGVPDDVIGSARRVISIAAKPASGGATMTYAAELTADLTEAIEWAESDWNGARGETSSQGDQKGHLRDLTGAMQRELVALRSALDAAIGKGHADYQLLRNPRTGSKTDDESVANDNAADETVEQAAPDADRETSPKRAGNG